MRLRTLLLWIAAIAAPFALISTLVIIVDPYNHFGWSKVVPDGLKEKNLYHSGATMPFSVMMWDLESYRRNPKDHILLGDSRLAYFDVDYLRQVSGHAYANLGIPGGDYNSIFDLFDYADSLTALKDVVVQVSFRNMSVTDWDLYSEPRMLMDNPLYYLTDGRVLRATALNLQSRLAPNTLVYDSLPPDQWQIVLAMDQGNADNFVLDTTIYDRLQQLADHCKAADARLRFVEFPIHPDAHAIYAKAGLDPLRNQYLARLSTIAETINLDRPGFLPDDPSLWRDPLHMTTTAQRILIDAIWGPEGSAPAAHGTSEPEPE